MEGRKKSGVVKQANAMTASRMQVMQVMRGVALFCFL